MNDSRRINILALPFLGLLAWNVVVYLLLAASGLRRRRPGSNPDVRSAGSAVGNIGRRLAPLAARTAQVDTVLGEAVQRFVTDWSHLGAPVLAQQMRQWLHLAAAALALGLVFGLYQRGVGHDFVAGWESLWFDPPQVQWLIATLFGPLAHWAGIALPETLDAVARLQFKPDGSGGESARAWVHLIALLLLTTVVLPRIALAALAWFKAWRLQRDGSLPPELQAYARIALGAGGQGLQIPIRVIPYAFAPAAAAIARLEPALQESFGRGARTDLQAPIAYGEEASLPSRMSDCREGCALLMNLAATPEIENHGHLLAAARVHQRDTGSAPCVLLVDEESYAARFGADEAAGLLDQRRRLWREFATRQGLEIRFLTAKGTA
jgi:hypothetical protein